jgi:hypothetical protein
MMVMCAVETKHGSPRLLENREAAQGQATGGTDGSEQRMQPALAAIDTAQRVGHIEAPMRSRLLLVLCLGTALLLAACRQPDGPLPSADVQVSNRLGDIGRDLMNIAGGDQSGANDLADDLQVFADDARGESAARELATRTGAALKGKPLSDEQSQQLANQLWVAVGGRQLSERQVESLRNDTKALLVTLGATEASATEVATQIGEVQQVVATRKRRWYERF